MRRGGESGQASVELIAAIPMMVLMALGAWQAVLAVRAQVAAVGAARAGARAVAVGGSGETAARTHVPEGFASRVRVGRSADGLRVTVAVPAALGGARLGTVSATGRFAGQ